MSDRIVQIIATTTSDNEDIMTFLKTKTLLNGDTENKAFRLTSCEFETSSNTNIKINDETNWSDLRADLLDGLYKFKTNIGEVSIKNFIVKDTGTSYFCKFTY